MSFHATRLFLVTRLFVGLRDILGGEVSWPCVEPQEQSAARAILGRLIHCLSATENLSLTPAW